MTPPEQPVNHLCSVQGEFGVVSICRSGEGLLPCTVAGLWKDPPKTLKKLLEQVAGATDARIQEADDAHAEVICRYVHPRDTFIEAGSIWRPHTPGKITIEFPQGQSEDLLSNRE